MQRSTQHATFFVERVYPASPARVFKAFANAEEKNKWFGDPQTNAQAPIQLDFRVSGRESSSGGPEGGPVYTFEATYQDIVPDERIVTTYEMHMDGQRISVSLTTTELLADGKGTRLKYTEQAVFLDELDEPRMREEGTNFLLDALGKYLEEETS